MSYDHVIFDNDGVLLDSTTEDLEWMERFRVEEAKKLGGQMTLEQSRKVFKANTAEEIRKIAEETGLTVSQLRQIEAKKSRKKIEKIKKGEISLFDSTVEVLKEIEQPKSMVSNAPLKATRYSLEHYNIQKYFQTVRSPRLDSIETYMEKKKPNPEMIEKTIREKGSSNPIYIGDSDTDIIAAEKAGIDSIHLETSGETAQNPTHTAKNLQQVLQIVK